MPVYNGEEMHTMPPADNEANRDGLSDAELSLAVAQIMWSDTFVYDHTTDDALGKMCVWLANYWMGRIDHGEDDCFKLNLIPDYLLDDNPHRAIAEAIVEVSNN